MLPADDPDENDTCDEHGQKYDHDEERAPERKLQKEHHYDRRAGKLDSISPISNSRPQPVLCGLRTEADQDDREIARPNGISRPTGAIWCATNHMIPPATTVISNWISILVVC